MRKFGLIGYPLGHSFSAGYFADKFRTMQLTNCRYDNYPLENIGQLINLVRNVPEIIGLNVTIPYKTAVIPFLESISEEASAIGAVNVIKIRRNDDNISLHGFNSDVTGIRDSIVPLLQGRKGDAIVLGTGGSSRAVIYVLKELGMNIITVSRTRKEGSVTYQDLDREKIRLSQIIVNTTPLGMYPDTGSKPDLDYTQLGEGQILFDLVYNPPVTMFMKEGQARGCIVTGGLKMLHSQAEKSWEIWNDENL